MAQPIRFFRENGASMAEVVVPTPAGPRRVHAEVTASELATIAKNVFDMAQAHNAKLASARVRGEQDPDEPMTPAFIAKMKAMPKMEEVPYDPDAPLPFSAAKKKAAPRITPKVKVEVGPVGPITPVSDSKAFKKLPAVEAKPLRSWGWSRRMRMLGDVWNATHASLGYAVGAHHCIKTRDGRVQLTRIFHCTPAQAVAGCAMAGEAEPITDTLKYAIIGAHVRSALIGRLTKELTPRQRRWIAAQELKARGYKQVGPNKFIPPKPTPAELESQIKLMRGDFTEMGVTGFKHMDEGFVDDAFHEQQMERAMNSGPNLMDKELHDASMGGDTFVGLTAIGVEAIEDGVILDGVKPRTYGEIIEPRELDAPEDLLEAATVLDEKPTKPTATAITTHLEGMSLGEAEERAALMSEDVVGLKIRAPKFIRKAVRGVGKGIRGVRKGVGAGLKAGVKVATAPVAIATKQFIPRRDAPKKALVNKLFKQVTARVAKYDAYKRGSRRPTQTEINRAKLVAKKLLMKHGMPTSLMGWSTAGLMEVPRHVWEQAGAIGPGFNRSTELPVTRRGEGYGFVGDWSLYYLNPLSWFRSKEVNALYLAQREAEKRKEKAQDISALTAETARKWAEVQAVENAVAQDVQRIFAAKGGKPQMTLVGVWWKPWTWWPKTAQNVMKEADLIAPDVEAVPLPPGAEAAPGEEPTVTEPEAEAAEEMPPEELPPGEAETTDEAEAEVHG